MEEASKLVEYQYSYTPTDLKITSIASTVAKLREKVAPFRFKLAAREISKTLQLEAGDKVLELGSGLGLLGEAIKDEVCGEVNYFALELAYKSAKSGLEKGLLGVHADVTNLPFPDNSFNALVTNDVLEHIPSSEVVKEIHRVLKPNGKAFIVIADPSEARFDYVHDHIDRANSGTDVKYWEELFQKSGFKLLKIDSEKYRKRDWRKIFNLPLLVNLKDKPGFACAFNPVNRPGTYILSKEKLD